MSRRSQPSSYIGLAAARSIHHARRFADPIGGEQANCGYPASNVTLGVPLNLAVTIKWSLTRTHVDRFDELRRERYARWLRTRAKQRGKDWKPTYDFVREGDDHVHWSVHIPEELIEEFTQLLPRWIASLENKGQGKRRRSENTDPVPERVVHITKIKNSVGARKYVLKGIDPRFASRFGIKPQPQGLVTKRRTGMSRNLGPKARKDAGYQPRPLPYRSVPVAAFAVPRTLLRPLTQPPTP